MNDSDYAALESQRSQFTVNFPVIQTFVNPQDKEYKEYFYENKFRTIFSSTLGANL